MIPYTISFYPLQTLPSQNNNFLIDCVQQNVNEIIIQNQNGTAGSIVVFNNNFNSSVTLHNDEKFIMAGKSLQKNNGIINIQVYASASPTIKQIGNIVIIVKRNL